MTEVDPHVQTLRDLLVAERDKEIVNTQRRADDAAARGDESFHKMYQDQVDRLRATRFPWEADLA